MKIGIYLGSFAPMHQGHSMMLLQAIAENDVLLFFPGLGIKGAKQGTKTVTINGQKVKEKKLSRVEGQVMITPEMKRAIFDEYRKALKELPDKHPELYERIMGKEFEIIMPGTKVTSLDLATMNNSKEYIASNGPINNVYEIVNSLALHYTLLGTDSKTGTMQGVDIPFYKEYYGLVDNPQVQLYSDRTDTNRASPSMLKRVLSSIRSGITSPEVVDELFAKNIFVLAGVIRGTKADREKIGELPQLDYPVRDVEFETMDISATDVRGLIYQLRNASDEEDYQNKLNSIKELWPNIIDPNVRERLIRAIDAIDRERETQMLSKVKKADQHILRKDIPSGPMQYEIKRRNRNDEGYGSYLEEIMNELQHIKKEYGSRTKAGSRYRLEANKLQGAYSELRKLKRKHEKQMENDQMLSERLVRKATGRDDYIEKDEEFNRDSIRDFFNKFK